MAMWNKQPMALSIAACLYANNGCVRYNVVSTWESEYANYQNTLHFTALEWEKRDVITRSNCAA